MKQGGDRDQPGGGAAMRGFAPRCGRSSAWHLCLPLLTAALLLPACVERRIRITSEPPGALVHLNDVELGRTPVETEFTFHGVYDVRLDLEGYEPLWTSEQAKAPLYEVPGIDLIAEALPRKIENHHHWHFTLEPAPELGEDPVAFEENLVDRAAEMREQVEPADEAAPPTTPPDTAE